MEQIQKILLAVDNEGLEKTIKKKMEPEYGFTTIATRKGMLFPLVDKERPDILIMKENLIGEVGEETYDILYNLRAQYPMMRIVLLYPLEEETVSALQKYIQIGIYDISTTKQIKIDTIIDMVKNPKNFGNWASMLSNSEVTDTTNNVSVETIKTPVLKEESSSNIGHLKIKQEEQHIDLKKQRVIPNLVKSSGYNMGRVKRTVSNNTKPQNPYINTEFELDENAEFTLDIDTVKPTIKSMSVKKDNITNDNNVEKVVAKPQESIQAQTSTKSQISLESHQEMHKQVTPSIPKQNVEKTISTKTIAKDMNENRASVSQSNDNNHRANLAKARSALLNKNKSTVVEKKDIKARTIVIPKEVKEVVKAPVANEGKQNIEKKKIVQQQKSHENLKVNEPVKKGDNLKKSANEKPPVTPKKDMGLEPQKTKPTNIDDNLVAKQTVTVGEECKIVLFANVEETTYSHTALNVAIILAKKGYQVAFIDDTMTSASDLLMTDSPYVYLYHDFLVKSRKLIADDNLKKIALLKTTEETNLFELVKRIKRTKEVHYIVVNVGMHKNFENLMVLANNNYINMIQNAVQLKKLQDNYGYRFKYMDIVLENFNDEKLPIKDILDTTRCKRIIKLKDTITMNYKTLVDKKPLVLDNAEKAELFKQLISAIEESN